SDSSLFSNLSQSLLAKLDTNLISFTIFSSVGVKLVIFIVSCLFQICHSLISEAFSELEINNPQAKNRVSKFLEIGV
ncbi:hypothetical protein FRX31_002662, partial [Thalictrum thalictroides]